MLVFCRMGILWWLRIVATGDKSLILWAILFVLWVLGKLKIPFISLLILMTTSWWLTLTTIAFRCSIKMETTSKPLEQGSSHALLVFAWIVREGSLSAKMVLTGFPSFRFTIIIRIMIISSFCSSFLGFFISLLQERKKKKEEEKR